jgi:RNA polymerase sigma factor (sigma-70 family)
VNEEDRGRFELPPELALLLQSPAGESDAFWCRFVERYSDLILHTAHRRSDGYDSAMDRYAFVLEALQRDGFRRLRNYAADGRGRFTTWLVVVTRRLCEDHRRRRYGRNPGSSNGESPCNIRRDARRRLVDFVMEDLDPNRQMPRAPSDAETHLRRTELAAALEEAMSELDPQDAVLIRLRYEDGLPAREIARILRLPTLFHVYRRCDSRLRLLREKLEARGIEDSHP